MLLNFKLFFNVFEILTFICRACCKYFLPGCKIPFDFICGCVFLFCFGFFFWSWNKFLFLCSQIYQSFLLPLNFSHSLKAFPPRLKRNPPMFSSISVWFLFILFYFIQISNSFGIQYCEMWRYGSNCVGFFFPNGFPMIIILMLKKYILPL